MRALTLFKIDCGVFRDHENANRETYPKLELGKTNNANSSLVLDLQPLAMSLDVTTWEYKVVFPKTTAPK